MKQTDPASNVALNGIVINDQLQADKLRVPLGETVAWTVAFPHVGTHLDRKAVPAS